MKKIIFVLSVIFLIGLSSTLYNMMSVVKDKKDNTDVLEKIEVPYVEEFKTERMLQVEELKKENNDIVGWIEISNTNISYPVLQTDNNDFYLNHNYKGEYTTRGSIFLDKGVNLNNSVNYLVYGHRTKTNLMFEQLLKYQDEDFYLNNKVIRFTTLNDDAFYEVISVFKSRVFYQNETDVFRYYYFINGSEEEFNYYVNEAKKASLYDTGVSASYGDQLLTLSTCEYSQTDGRFVVVAKRVGVVNE